MIPRSAPSLPVTTYLALILGAVTWCAAIVLAPVFLGSGGVLVPAGELLYNLFGRVCHQMEGRSVLVAGHPLAVCLRCSSIYGAFLLMSLLYPVFRSATHSVLPARLPLVVATGFLVADVAGGILGIHDVTLLSRVLTGGLFGAVVPWYIIPAVQQGVRQILRPTPSIAERVHPCRNNRAN